MALLTLALVSCHACCKRLFLSLCHSAEPSIKISAEDIAVVTEELEVTKEEAHAALLKGHGDVVQALRHLLQ